MKQSRTMTIATVVVVALILAAAIVVPRLSGGGAQAAAVDYAGQPFVGDAAAPAKMIVFFDFLCPHCAEFAEDVTAVLRREYVADGQLAIYWANFPVIAPQGMSRTLAMVGECLNRQGADGFGLIEPVFLRSQANLANASRAYDLVSQYVPGADVAALRTCVESGETAANVDSDVTMARGLGITGTPTVYVGDRLVANPTLANVRAAIDAALAE